MDERGSHRAKGPRTRSGGGVGERTQRGLRRQRGAPIVELWGRLAVRLWEDKDLFCWWLARRFGARTRSATLSASTAPVGSEGGRGLRSPPVTSSRRGWRRL